MIRSFSPTKGLTTAVFATAVIVGCGSEPTSDPESPTLSEVASGPVDVEFRGCTTVLAPLGNGPITCVYTPPPPETAEAEVDKAEKAEKTEKAEEATTLRLWVDHADAKSARILLDDRPIPATPRELESDSGAGFEVPLGKSGLMALKIVVPNAEPWILRLQDVADLDPAVKRARAGFRKEGGELQRRLKDGDHTALEPLDALVRNGLSRGLLDDVVSFVPGASYFTNSRLEDPNAALQIVDAVVPLTKQRYPHGHARLQAYRSKALRRMGRRLDATMAARDGSRMGMRLDDEKLQRDGLAEYSMLLAQLGYRDAAAYWSAKALELNQKSGESTRLLLLQMVAATHLQLERAGHPDADARLYHEQIVERSGPDGDSPHVITHAHSLISLASLAVLHGDPQGALDLLETLDLTTLPTPLRADALDVELLALVTLDADPKLLRSRLAMLETLMARVPENAAKYSAAVRRAHVLDVLGDTRAERAYQEAERMLDLLIPLSALGIGGEGSATQLSEGTNRYLSFLLRGPAPRRADALCVARQAHARLARMSLLTQRLDGESRDRILRAADRYLESKDEYESAMHEADTLPVDELELAAQRTERMSAQLQRQAQEILLEGDGHYTRPSCEELSPRQPGEVLLGLHPLEDSVLALVSSDAGYRHHEFELPEPGEDGRLPLAELAVALLDPIEDQLQHAEQIRVLSSDAANAIPVHALSWNEQALGLQRPVVYSLELPPVEDTSAPTQGRRAVVHSDVAAHPDGADTAAQDGERQLSQRGFEVRRFDTNYEHGAEIRDALIGTDHFLYAGHAYFQSSSDSDEGVLWPPYPGGSESEPSFLPLTEFARLEIADILMTQPAPDVAVLFGCATGVIDQRTRHGGKSLAAAFLSAGSSVAIASTRPIPSQQAWILAEALYDQLPEGRLEPGRWMQRALQAARLDGLYEESIADYRVFVP